MDLEAYIQVVPLVPDVILPFRATNSSTGYDVSSSTNVQIPAHSSVTVPLGFKIAFHSTLHCSLNPRSSLSSKGVHASVGTIDPDYRGEVKRIGQLVFTKSAHPPITTVNSLPDTERGSSGFGSTDIHSAKRIQRTSFHTPLTTIPEHGIDENDSHEDEELLPEPRSISHLIPHLSPKLQIPQSYDVSNLSATELDAILHPFRNEVLVDDVTPPHEESAPFDDDRHVRLLHSV